MRELLIILIVGIFLLSYSLYKLQQGEKKRIAIIKSAIRAYLIETEKEKEPFLFPLKKMLFIVGSITSVFILHHFFGFANTFLISLILVGFVFFRHKKQEAKKRQEFIDALPQALDAMARSLKSGLSLYQSMDVIRGQNFGSVSVEIGYVLDSLKLGITFKEALEKSAARVPIKEYQFLTLSLLIQQETGGGLVDLLTNLKDSLRQKHFMEEKARALSSQTRTSAIVLASLPFISFIGIFFLNRDYITILIHDPRGRYLGGTALVLLFLGLLLIRQMMKTNE
jgi:tight adherence protein B